ncbi:hypothetical protein SDC9_158410 [bioreactor metagenome]|uniref:Uncharacterized protein n=1 Tax=bioreactor metagenome TaxID=1076179 RepID=A0A645FCN0_9ZZZZ
MDSLHQGFLFGPVFKLVVCRYDVKPLAAEDDTLGPGTSPLVAAYVQGYLKQPGLFAALPENGLLVHHPQENLLHDILCLFPVAQVEVADSQHIIGIAQIKRFDKRGRLGLIVQSCLPFVLSAI